MPLLTTVALSEVYGESERKIFYVGIILKCLRYDVSEN
jgi:hypothetical protein